MLPKKEREVVINFDKREVLSPSKQYPLHIENIKNRSFKVKLKSDRSSSYTFFPTGVDANGKKISIGFSSDNHFFNGGHNFFDSTFRISEDTLQNPITFKLQAYPNYLECSAKIKLFK
ncbi:hypothetical protein ACQKM9_08865 [Viridibacillus sp. NPDC093762]|uniref:hypothetical protein n=1 Tax=Viridibacillus sp. NPDC093762 TaxID=3390720 RepID=UPI003D072875